MYILIGFASFLFMKFIAWFSHKYIMHGFLWVLHKDHHAPKQTRLEKNDLFALIFAIPGFLGIYSGLLYPNTFALAMGIGITAYGLSYFLYHDVLYHQRFKVFRKPRNWYLKAIIKAHYDHHIGKKNFGFLFLVPLRYMRDEYNNRKAV